MSLETRAEQQNPKDGSRKAAHDSTSQPSRSVVELGSASDYSKLLDKMGAGFERDKSAQLTLQALEFKPINKLVDAKQFDASKPFAYQNSYKGDGGLLDSGNTGATTRSIESKIDGGDGKASISATDKVSLKSERTLLDKDAKANLSPADYKHFKESMRKFEARKGKNDLSEDEIARTYSEVGRILDAKGNQPLTPEQRKNIAQQIMENAAEPTKISQGNNNTCNVTTVETAMYTRHPSEAAKLVADVSLTGQYTTKSGKVVEMNPTPRTDEARNYPPRTDGQRTHASEIFQITAVNVSYQEAGIARRYDQISMPPPQNRTDNGERLYDTSKDPKSTEEVKKADGKPMRSPGMSTGDLVNLSINLTGKVDIMALMSPSYGGSDGRVGTVNSEKELESKLSLAKKDGKFPMIILVNTEIEPLRTDSGAGSAGGSGGAHVITITDFQAGPPAKVNVDNQWTNDKDYQGAKKLSVHDLYKVMQSNGEAMNIAQQDVDHARKQGKVDLPKEMELLHLQKKQGVISDTEYANNLSNLAKHLQAAKPDDKRSVTRQFLEAIDATKGFPIDKHLALLEKLNTTGFLKDTFTIRVYAAGWDLAREKKDLDSMGKMNADDQKKFDADVKTYRDFVNKLPASQKNQILEYLKGTGI